MIGLWLLAGSLTFGTEELRTSSELERISDSVILRIAEDAYREGLGLLHDSRKALPHFERARHAYAKLWDHEYRTPLLAGNLAQLSLICDQLPEAIIWYHRGLALDPRNRNLRDGLTLARSKVRYSIEEESKSARPGELSSIIFDGNPCWMAGVCFALYSGSWLLLARGWMRQRRWVFHTGFFLLLVSLAIAYGYWREQRSLFAELKKSNGVIGDGETVLRIGNGALYPPRLRQPLPAGLEVKILLVRGDWLQIELLNGVIGWIRAEEAIFDLDQRIS